MIPKIIHYCWFGRGEKPKLAQKCIASWKKYCPDYEIIEWNEDSFDVNMNDYTQFTSERHMYAYLSDYVRLWAIEQYGGFYFDTDVEIIKPLEPLRQYSAVFGFENEEYINTGEGFGSEPHQQVVLTMLRLYEEKTREQLSEDFGNWGHLTGSPKMNTRALLPFGLRQDGTRQSICGAEIFPSDYFCPFDDITGELNIKPYTISIHWYMKSANGKWAAIRSKFTRPLHRIVKKVRKRP